MFVHYALKILFNGAVIFLHTAHLIINKIAAVQSVRLYLYNLCGVFLEVCPWMSESVTRTSWSEIPGIFLIEFTKPGSFICGIQV